MSVREKIVQKSTPFLVQSYEDVIMGLLTGVELKIDWDDVEEGTRGGSKVVSVNTGLDDVHIDVDEDVKGESAGASAGAELVNEGLAVVTTMIVVGVAMSCVVVETAGGGMANGLNVS